MADRFDTQKRFPRNARRDAGTCGARVPSRNCAQAIRIRRNRIGKPLRPKDKIRAFTVTDHATKLRHAIHQNPELSGREAETAQRVLDFFLRLKPDLTVRPLGGHGLAFVFGESSGPTVLLRCELDALPIEEPNRVPYRSIRNGIAHKCGHDGHMAILAAVGEVLSEHRPRNGRVVLLFQPAEETGAGAAAVLRDTRFVEITPDFVFALHNLPGFPLGQIVVRAGTFACASRGMTIKLRGESAHAAQPDTGRSPAFAACEIIRGLSDLRVDPRKANEINFATVVGATIGEKAFGTAPGHAEVWVTLRSETDIAMTQLVDRATELVSEMADNQDLDFDIRYEDVFDATVNSARAVDLVVRAAGNLQVVTPNEPMRWSEDFGRFSAVSDGALVGIGAGAIPDLHSPDYDFPDELIPIASALMQRIIQQCHVQLD